MDQENNALLVTPEQLVSWGIQFDDSQLSENGAIRFDVKDLSVVNIPNPPDLAGLTQASQSSTPNSIITTNMIIPETELTQSISEQTGADQPDQGETSIEETVECETEPIVPYAGVGGNEEIHIDNEDLHKNDGNFFSVLH